MARLLKGKYTLGIIKPDLFSQPNCEMQARKIKDLMQRNNVQIIKSHRTQLTKERAEQFYGEHAGKFFYQRLISFMTSGPLELMVLESNKDDLDVITHWRTLMGPTHAEKARANSPNSIRAQFGYSDTRNVVHGSDSPDNAEKEVSFFFPELFEEHN
ncbi:hypothetical protein PROFUN_02705 [Planoprotostelium fungivorum]|uniref:Nucleoside diphosphate kinase n=1 Tax=Planoprotostelium fungivorum TaxID=1890364 RepID=A0A2P6NVS6_9EUKA|nr:hypothetical protein PROFUN_02705 [Planoprotostelium fungivorum]